LGDVSPGVLAAAVRLGRGVRMPSCRAASSCSFERVVD
jgi:hypothetical protein